TAVYGDYDHPYVHVLRTFRDGTLAHFGWGRSFIAWYYAHSPPWADWLRAHAWARIVAQVVLAPVVAMCWLWNTFGLWLAVLPAGGGAGAPSPPARRVRGRRRAGRGQCRVRAAPGVRRRARRGAAGVALRLRAQARPVLPRRRRRAGAHVSAVRDDLRGQQ